MTPTEEINGHLATLRAKLGNIKPDGEAALQLLEMHARQHAHQMETREEYVARIEKVANDRATTIKEKSAEADDLRTRLAVHERDPKVKAEKVARIKEQQAALAAELAKEEGES